jgi:hypothetical protein
MFVTITELHSVTGQQDVFAECSLASRQLPVASTNSLAMWGRKSHSIPETPEDNSTLANYPQGFGERGVAALAQPDDDRRATGVRPVSGSKRHDLSRYYPAGSDLGTAA